MKVKSIILGIITGLFSTTVLATLDCSGFQCDVKWKTNMGEIDIPTICYNFKGKPEYQECRNLAVDVFKERCSKGKNNNNQIWVDIYCEALKKYKP
jgi:hypothetical protein